MGLQSFFFIFYLLPITLILWVLVPRKVRLTLCIVASLTFYLWLDATGLPVIILLTLINYAGGRWISTRRGAWSTRALIAANLAALIFYKTSLPAYLSLHAECIQQAALGAGVRAVRFFTHSSGTHAAVPQAMTPLGVSFAAFVGISYLLDVWHGKVVAEERLSRFAGYFLFFPKIVAGPITRYTDVWKRFGEADRVPITMPEGISRFIVGLAKKVLVADAVGKYVSIIFAQPPNSLSASLAWTGLAFFTIQILYDFAGYTDMAIGVAAMLGVRLPENFARPYEATSVTEFWRSWHITLSTWFRDYVYYPLEWRLRRSRIRGTLRYVNVILVFLLTGLWHGVTGHYAAWGLIHGGTLALEQTTAFRRLQRRIPKTVQRGFTLAIVILGWVFFRSPSIPHALRYLRALVPLQSDLSAIPMSVLPPISHQTWVAWFVGVALAITPIGRHRLIVTVSDKSCTSWAMVARTTGLLLLFAIAVMFLASGSAQPVLYGGF